MAKKKTEPKTKGVAKVPVVIQLEALDRMNCTRIVIAHRLSTIRQCDRIVMQEDGKIIEDGTYEELLQQNGKFAEMVARQQLENETGTGVES